MSHSSLSQDKSLNSSFCRSKYQLRLYCTTSTFYTPAPGSFRTSTQPCPIEFPATCEVRVNNNVLQANLKGIKKKPGTAPPADLSKLVRVVAGCQNRIDMVYVNSQANTGPKVIPLPCCIDQAANSCQEILLGGVSGRSLFC